MGALSTPTVTFRDIKARGFYPIRQKNPPVLANTVPVLIEQKYRKKRAVLHCFGPNTANTVPTHAHGLTVRNAVYSNTANTAIQLIQSGLWAQLGFGLCTWEM